jgi:DNA repair exonuclease SbcCD ATPase subunit
VLRGLEQVCAELEARDLSADSLTRELDDTKKKLRAREDELANEVELWDEARREAERCGDQLAELQSRLVEKEHELSEASASAAAWAARAAEIDDETEALAGRVENAFQALETLAATRFAANGADLSRQGRPLPSNGRARKRAAQTGVLYFVPKAEGYDLVEREGDLPSVGEALTFGDEQFVVTKIGRSPLPFDRRNCVFLTTV